MSGLLGGLSVGEIPIAGTKRRSFGPQIGGQVFRVGRVWANRAFVVVRGNLRLLYVAREYRNYAAVARRVFDKDGRRYDYDHVLARALCRQQGFDYILLTRIERSANRSHGRLERPQFAPAELQSSLIVLDKFCFADDRIFYKLLGVPYRSVPAETRVPGYQLTKHHERKITPVQSVRLRRALGMNVRRIDLTGLAPIHR